MRRSEQGTGSVRTSPSLSRPFRSGRQADQQAAALETLKKVYAFLPGDARIVPGHGVAMGREDVRWHIDYLTAVRDNVQAAIDQGLTLEQTVVKVKMPEFRGYALFDWVHPSLNVPAAFKDLSAKPGFSHQGKP